MKTEHVFHKLFFVQYMLGGYELQKAAEVDPLVHASSAGTSLSWVEIML